MIVHQWLKQAILLLFRLRAMETVEVSPFEFADKRTLKKRMGCRPGCGWCRGASARWGSFLGNGDSSCCRASATSAPGWGAGTMVDAWATVGLVRPDR